MQTQIRWAIAEVAAAEGATAEAPLHEAQLMAALLRHNLVGTVAALCRTAYTDAQDAARAALAASRLSSRPKLLVTVRGGTAFIAAGSAENSPLLLPGSGAVLLGGYGGSAGSSRANRGTLTVHAHYRKQRFVSRAVECTENPVFAETFPFNLPKEVKAAQDLADPIHLLLCRHEHHRNKTVLLASHTLRWQPLLFGPQGSGAGDGDGDGDTSGGGGGGGGGGGVRAVATVSMNGIGAAASSLPAGSLSLVLQHQPAARGAVQWDPLGVHARLEAAHALAMQRDNLFLAYARRWWHDYLGIRKSHSARQVTLFMADEAGRSRAACRTVQPLPAGRWLDTPQQAARFVSLLEQTTAGAAAGIGSGGSQQQVWGSLHATLCKKAGSVEDHAALLCSLLLGFGADAYVCIGHAVVAPSLENPKGLKLHAWVATIGTAGRATFWESLSGDSWPHTKWDPAFSATSGKMHNYRTLGCVFNHATFYANIQSSDRLTECEMNLRDPGAWKAVGSDVIASIPYAQGKTAPPLAPARPEAAAAMGARLERELRQLACEHRADIGLGLRWDEGLARLLAPFLAAYELEKCAGTPPQHDDFQHNVQRATPKGHTFKAFPIQFTQGCTARGIMKACIKDPLCAEILEARGDRVLHGMRVRVFAYPEGTCAVWLMLCASFRSIL